MFSALRRRLLTLPKCRFTKGVRGITYGMDHDEFQCRGKEVIDKICHFRDTIGSRKIIPDVEFGYLRNCIPSEAPKCRESFDEIMRDFEEKIVPGLTLWNHHHFFAYFPCGDSYPTMLAEMLCDYSAGIHFGGWQMAPSCAELEEVVMDWFAEALGLPNFFKHHCNSEGGGYIQAGASQATFLATVAARARSIKSLKGDKCDLPDSYYLPKLVAYYSENCHSSVEKAAKLCLLQLRKLPAEDNHRVRGSTLEKAIQKDVECGLVPCIVSAAIGSTSVASCDKLTEFGPICKRFPNLWLHVDGAYSGNFCILPELRYILDGIECADSIIVNCKKALLMLMDCEALFLKEKKHLSEALCAGPPYIPYGLQTDQDDPGIYDTGFSHRNRALKLWYLFRSYGVEGLQQHLRTTICLARCFKALLEMDERFEVTNDVLFALVCFRLRDTTDEINKQLFDSINCEADIYLTETICSGKFMIRWCVVYPDPTEEDVYYAWKVIKRHAEKILNKSCKK